MIQTPRLNRHRLETDWRRIQDRIIPDEDEVDPDVDSREKQILLFTIAAGVVGAIYIAARLPWYFTEKSSKRYIIITKSHWYIPHYGGLLIISAVVTPIPGTSLVGFYAVGWSLMRVIAKTVDDLLGRRLGVREQIYQQLFEDEVKNANDPTNVPPDKYHLPVADLDPDGNAPTITPQLDKDLSVLTLGETRSGKTSSIKMMAAQLQYGPTTAVVAHGSVGEYTDYFASQIGEKTLRVGKNGDVIWNMFREVPADADDETAREKFRQLSSTMIPMKGTESNPHFKRAARNVMTELLLTIWQEQENPHHGHIAETLRMPPDDIADWFADRGKSATVNQIADDGGSDVWATLTGQIKPMFAGDFARSGDFSFREYINNPNGRAVVVESPEVIRGTGEMFSAMLDETLSRMMQSRNPTYAILDEIDTLPPLQVLGDMAARGLAQDSRLIVGVQTMSQLQDTYGEDTAQGVIGNMPQLVGLSPGTGDDVEMLQASLGDRIEQSRSSNSGLSIGQGGVNVQSGDSVSETLRKPIKESTMRNWDSGECVVISRTGWWHCRLADPESAIPRLRETRGSVVQQQQQPQGFEQSSQRQTATDWDDQTESDTHVNVSNTGDGRDD